MQEIDLIDAFLQKMANGENGETSTFTGISLLFIVQNELTVNNFTLILYYL